MKLVFATHNQHKVNEVQSLLPNNITILSLNDIGCFEEIPETAATLEGNATLKADFVTANYGYDCFADDTGLLVDALNGAPGVLSARYAGEQKSAAANMTKLLDALKDKNNRTARFKTCIALNIQTQKLVFNGEVEGEITMEKHGTEGFGYDPIFKPTNFTETFAELPMDIKNEISHRGKAVKELITYLNQNHK
tara:strand:- start:21057 stop:21638 length:582 start_codon:yes stop_codon:yes gene_type:complete